MKPRTRAARQGRARHNVTLYDADLQELIGDPSAEAVGVYAADATLEIKATCHSTGINRWSLIGLVWRSS